MQTPPTTLTLSQLAREVLTEADGDTETASEALTNRLLEDRSLLQSVISQAVADAVAYRVRYSMRSERAWIVRQATRPPAAPSHGSKDDVIALAKGLAASLLDMPLARGVRLRDATREQVQEQADMYAAQASDMGHKARWLNLIAQAIPADSTVGDVLTDARATELWKEVA